MLMRVAVLGSTGSIGANTLDVIARHPNRFEVFALSAYSRVDLLAEQVARFRPKFVVLPAERVDAFQAIMAAKFKGFEHIAGVLSHSDALKDIASHPDVDAVMAAIVGAAGLPACLAAARAGKRLMLANKEALVVGGQVFLDAVEQGGATLLPIDSEHSAIFQCLPIDRKRWPQTIDKLILTASGGPFRTRDPQTLADVTPEQAVAHPNWVMGRKISVDSATMMNKALEVIEAHYLFGIAPDKIEVAIHPQSVIHSMVQTVDGSVLAQLGTPDMRVPIAYGLSWPERIESGSPRLDFTNMANLSFETADAARFPGLHLAWEALRAPTGTTAVLNASNEVAVDAFLHGRLRYDRIFAVNRETLDQLPVSDANTLEALLDWDTRARRVAENLVARWASEA
jgi:1-deoxy-D-xylulose-5-phosphate reductoisomerase